MDKENTNPTKGELLIADPFIDDPYFRRSVILIAEHDIANGTIGFIMNKPLNLQLSDLVKDFPDFSVDVYYGGPVSTESLYFVHSFTPDVMSGSVQITENLFWGGSFEQLKTLILEGKVNKNELRFFIGYSGWSPDQLVDEINSNSWLIKEREHPILNEDVKSMWKKQLQDMEDKKKIWSNMPHDINMN